MADQDAQERNLPASERKLRKAREEGQVARSRDLSHFAAIGGGIGLLMWGAPWLADWSTRLMRHGLHFDARTVQNPALMLEQLVEVSLGLIGLLVVLGLAMMALGVLAGVGSGGWNWTWKAVAPKASKLNPISGLGNIFSRQQLLVTLKACLLAVVIGSIGLAFLYHRLSHFSHALTQPLPAAAAQVLGDITAGLALLLLALGAFALLDVPLQRFMLANRLKMSHKEMREEHKELEGNPEVKAKLRAKMRELGKKRMLAEVPTADLVVMNPTHYAVALRYDETKMGAPRVVAKGTDLLALRIRDIAREAGVPVLDAPPLARALHAHAELDREIPAALFAAVAQVLAWVYQLRAVRGTRQPEPPKPANLPVPSELDPHINPQTVAEARAEARRRGR